MAEAKKTTKKTTPKAELSLTEQLKQKRNDLLEAKKSHRSGELVNPRILRDIKRDIARIMTKVNAEKESK